MNVAKSDYWENRYRQGQTGWDRAAVHPALLDWLDQGPEVFPPGARVAVPGCGHGYEVVELARRGFRVTAIDFAREPMQRLEESLKEAGAEAALVQQDLFEYRPEQPFDVIYEQTCLCAIDPARRKAYEAWAHENLKPGGSLLVLLMQTDDPQKGPPFHCDVDSMREIFPADRWEWSSEIGRYDHPSGMVHELAYRLVRR